ncbi:MAG TPA: hypothetical protein K8V35_01050 [Aliicoccus persicus]|uniref:Uncharacterized protein n=1 Tax=Aliicoccus persicus TaxID=930138 RepID=A0A921B5K5_9STAP|nr:hypothetical protein [Aliicoccus persicus]
MDPNLGVVIYLLAIGVTSMLLNAVLIQLLVYTPLRGILLRGDKKEMIGFSFIISYIIVPAILMFTSSFIPPFQSLFFNMLVPFLTEGPEAKIAFNVLYFIPGIFLILLNTFIAFKNHKEKIIEAILVLIAFGVYTGGYFMLTYMQTL